MKRGDVGLIDYPFSKGGGSKVRPALVIQTDRNNLRLQETIVAVITSNVSRAAFEATQYLIEPAHPDWKASGLMQASGVKCENIYTFDIGLVLRLIGRLSAASMQHVNDCLKASL